MSITARGGYQIVDFKNVKLVMNADVVTIPGIWKQIINAYNKPLVFYNLNLQIVSPGDAEKYPVLTLDNIVFNPGGVAINLSPEINGHSGQYIYVNDDDSVEFTDD